MMQLGRGVGRANRRRLYRVQAVHTPAFVRRKPKQIKGMCGHVTAGRNGSQGPGSPAIGLRRWGGRPGSPATGLRRWGGRPGSPAIGLRRWGGRPGSPAIGLRRWGGRPGSRSGGRRGFVGQVEGRRSRDQPIAQADVVEKSAFLLSGWGFSLSPAESSVMLVWMVLLPGQMFAQVVRRASGMFAC